MGSLERLKNLAIFRPLESLVYGRRFEKNQHEQLFRGIYRTMAEAAASAPPTRPLGYDHPAAAAMYRNLIDTVSSFDYPVLFWLQTLASEVRTVFDFGGHVGIKFYAYQRLLRPSPGFSWTVCDVPHVAAAGADLAQQRAARNLRFVSDFAQVDGHDLLLCSGSLQYVEEPLAEMLTRVERRPRHILLNLTPFDDGPTFFTLNSIGTAFCPYKVQDFTGFVSRLDDLGYELMHRWVNAGKTFDVSLHPEKSRCEYRGLYLRLRPT